MKKLVLTPMLVFLITTSIYSQHIQSKSEIMRDSLWNSVYNFCLVVDKYLNKDYVNQEDVNNFLNYVSCNMRDSLQSSEFFVPYTVSKEQAMIYLTEQTKDMIGSKCNYSFISWDGWDGKTPYTAFRLDVTHNGYKDQFLIIVSTTNKIHCILSVNSKI